MIFQKKYYIDTTEGVDCVAVTHEVHYAIRDAVADLGMVTVLIPHAGAGVLTGESLPEVLAALRQVVAQWSAGGEAEVRDAKQRSVTVAASLAGMLIGRSCTIPFAQGRLLLDPYSDLLVCDFTSKAQRREFVVHVQSVPPPAAKTPPPEEP
ncbi:MAG: YjbQ family protein [Deltaproteobacteria bacterium]|nr:YjbQ family protein [Deltaproteobacteria bacterium]